MQQFKIIVKPRLVTWDMAKAVARKCEGRLLLPKEALSWADREEVGMDMWLEGTWQDHGHVPYFSAARQSVLQKPADGYCLLVFLADPQRIRELRKREREQSANERRLRLMRRRR